MSKLPSHADGHDAPEVVQNPSRLTNPYNDGMQYVPYSDKQAIPQEQGYFLSEKEKAAARSEALSKSQRRYCGMRRKIFFALVAVIIVIIIAAAVGGGVGGSLANKSSNTSSNADLAASTTGSTSTSIASSSSTIPTSTTSTSTSSQVTSSAPAATATTTPSNGMGAYDCPAENGTEYTSSLYPQTFEILCDSDWPNGADGINGGTVEDLNTGVIATSIEACIDQCAGNNAGGGDCSAVSYGANITLALSRGGITGNCFMKTQRGAKTSHDGSGQAMAAFLVSS